MASLAPSVAQLEAMEDMDVTALLVEKLIQHMPCLIRFGAKSQTSTSPGYDDHTGILFGCHYSSGRFEFGIYFKDPLQMDSKMTHIQFVNKAQRSYKVFAGTAFIMTCYYHWDEEGHMTSSSPYTRNFYDGAEVQLEPNSSDKWRRMKHVLPEAVRKRTDLRQVHTFLSGGMNNTLPLANKRLLSVLDPTKCNPRQFYALVGRRKLMGRGIRDPTQPQAKRGRGGQSRGSRQGRTGQKRKADSEEETIHKKNREAVDLPNLDVLPPITLQPSLPPLSCPGCERQISEFWQNNPSFSCCSISICQACADMRAEEWQQDNHQSCIGTWITKKYCGKYVPNPSSLLLPPWTPLFGPMDNLLGGNLLGDNLFGGNLLGDNLFGGNDLDGGLCPSNWFSDLSDSTMKECGDLLPLPPLQPPLGTILSPQPHVTWDLIQNEMISI
jgi:hypothetical protein